MKIRKHKPLSVLCLALFWLPCIAEATAWECRNDQEIGCNAEQCTVTSRDESTALSLVFDSTGQFFFGAYENHFIGGRECRFSLAVLGH